MSIVSIGARQSTKDRRHTAIVDRPARFCGALYRGDVALRTLVELGGRWQVVAKVFHHEPIETAVAGRPGV